MPNINTHTQTRNLSQEITIIIIIIIISSRNAKSRIDTGFRISSGPLH